MSERVIAALALFAHKQAALDGVLRALLTHDGWLRPTLAGEVPPGHLWLFSDDERARRGGHLGAVPAGVPGFEAFRPVEGVSRIEVNHGSPPEETFTIDIDASARGLLALWCSAIALESVLAGGAETPAATARLRAHPAFLILLDAKRNPVTVRQQLGLPSAAVAFTAPDAVTAFLGRMAPEARSGLTRGGVDGGTLFPLLVRSGVGGLILNLFGPPAPLALPIELCKRVAEAGAA